MKGNELKQLRESLDLTQAEFGKIFGYHQAQIRISEFERGARKIPVRVISGCAYLREKAGAVPIRAVAENFGLRIPGEATGN